MPAINIRPFVKEDHDWAAEMFTAQWGSETVVVHETVYHPIKLPGFVAERGKERLGLITYSFGEDACEIITLNSLQEKLGVGTALLEASQQAARARGCHRIWLITTNDNLPALRFYQKRGFVIAAVHVNTIEKDRRLKPEIPLNGLYGIAIRDEIELEYLLG